MITYTNHLSALLITHPRDLLQIYPSISLFYRPSLIHHSPTHHIHPLTTHHASPPSLVSPSPSNKCKKSSIPFPLFPLQNSRRHIIPAQRSRNPSIGHHGIASPYASHYHVGTPALFWLPLWPLIKIYHEFSHQELISIFFFHSPICNFGFDPCLVKSTSHHIKIFCFLFFLFHVPILCPSAS